MEMTKFTPITDTALETPLTDPPLVLGARDVAQPG